MRVGGGLTGALPAPSYCLGSIRSSSVTHKATKIVIITEKLISDGVAQLIEECGASGYTVVAAGGKGSRGVRTASAASIAGISMKG